MTVRFPVTAASWKILIVDIFPNFLLLYHEALSKLLLKRLKALLYQSTSSVDVDLTDSRRHKDGIETKGKLIAHFVPL
jgi:hypothetical protein